MTYTYDQTIEFLQRAVADKGDGHTAECAYADLVTRQPVCIVGHVFSYVGLLGLQMDSETITGQPQHIRDHFTPMAVQALIAAQRVQDGIKEGCGRTWGEALIAAKGLMDGGWPA